MDYVFSGAGNGIKRPVSVILEQTAIYDTNRESFRELVQQLTGMATSPPTSAPEPVVSRLQHYAPPPVHPGSYPDVLLPQSSIFPESAFACSSTEEMGFMPVDNFSTESAVQYFSPLSISPTPPLSSNDPLWSSLMEFETPGTAAMRLWIESLLANEEASTGGFGTADQGLTSTQRAVLPSRGELVISPLFGSSCHDCKREDNQCICRQRA